MKNSKAIKLIFLTIIIVFGFLLLPVHPVFAANNYTVSPDGYTATLHVTGWDDTGLGYSCAGDVWPMWPAVSYVESIAGPQISQADFPGKKLASWKVKVFGRNCGSDSLPSVPWWQDGNFTSPAQGGLVYPLSTSSFINGLFFNSGNGSLDNFTADGSLSSFPNIDFFSSINVMPSVSLGCACVSGVDFILTLVNTCQSDLAHECIKPPEVATDYICDGTKCVRTFTTPAGKKQTNTYTCLANQTCDFKSVQEDIGPPCNVREDCPADIKSCDTENNIYRETEYICNPITNKCEMDQKPDVQCPNNGVPYSDPVTEKPLYSCLANVITQNYIGTRCNVESKPGEGHCWPNTRYWRPKGDDDVGHGTCVGKDQLPFNSKCTVSGLKEQFKVEYCDPATVNTGIKDPNDPANPILDPGVCSIKSPWYSSKCQNGCVMALDAPDNQRCGVGATGGSGVELKFFCTQCIPKGTLIPNPAGFGLPITADNDFCNGPYPDWKPAIDCGTPQNVVKTFCSVNNVKCTLTVNYPGLCYYKLPGIVGGCIAPTVNLACAGPCDNDNDDNVCPNGQTDPHFECVDTGKCALKSDCGVSDDCDNCPCPPNQYNPHTVCNANGTSRTVDTCGENETCGCTPGATKDCDCGGVIVCTMDGTWPECPAKHTVCENNKCKCITGAGDDACGPLGSQCACGITGEQVACTGGGYTTYDENGTLLPCASHTVCETGTCKVVNTPATPANDACQIGVPCVCSPIGSKQNCPGGGVSTCTANDWSACPPFVCDNQCVPGKECPCGGVSICVNGKEVCPDKHTECNPVSGKCECVDGSDENECDNVGASCVGCGPTQKVCGLNCCNSNQICDVITKTCSSCTSTQTPCGAGCCNEGYICNPAEICVRCVGDECGPEVTPYIPTEDPCGAAKFLGSPGIGMTYFKWLYKPGSSGYPQKNYRIEVSTQSGANFEDGIVYDSGIASGTVSSVMFRVYPKNSTVHNPPFINYGVSYYWRVKVWDTAGQSSLTTNYNNETAYKYPFVHPSPFVSYTGPKGVTPGTSGRFTDQSICYYDDGTPYNCRELTSAVCTEAPDHNGDGAKDCYGWWLEITKNSSVKTYIETHDPSDPAIGSIIIPDINGVGPYFTYNSPGASPTALQICDDVACCYASKNIKIDPSNANKSPLYQEVPSL